MSTVNLLEFLDTMAIYISNSLQTLKGGKPIKNLILPNLGKEKRFSEQEARKLAMVYLLTNYEKYPDIQFSFEVPTQEKYRQSGQKFSVAHFDMALERKASSSRWVNMEFKVNQVGEQNLKKDFEKLLVENQPGFFYLTTATVNHNKGINRIKEKILQVMTLDTDNTKFPKQPLAQILQTYSSSLYFYLYELNADSLYRIVINKETKMDSLKDISSEFVKLQL